ncbi:MAG TPA: BT4734/BF3469 family protein, partial [Dysgonamonadaceae bacterium]|nr:BT4734/BF3469 family protein [Dysgonamonadaceae bacterium]
MENGSRVSFFEAPISNTKPSGELSLGDVHRLITGEKYKARTEQLRALADKREARRFKAASFDYCTFSGVFGLRANHALVEHSGLLCMDLDHLPDVAKMKQRLLADRLFDTQLLFVSPSGDGLKWVVPVDLSRASHEEYFDGVARYLHVCYGVEADKSGRDVSRACFLPYDPDAYLGSGGG